jgi:hypothetical protein
MMESVEIGINFYRMEKTNLSIETFVYNLVENENGRDENKGGK